jgi:hypothetical protein
MEVVVVVVALGLLLRLLVAGQAAEDRAFRDRMRERSVAPRSREEVEWDRQEAEAARRRRLLDS